MKTLIFGSLKMEVDLDQHGVDLLVEDIKVAINLAERDFKWRTRNAESLSNFNQSVEGDIIHPNRSRSVKNRKVKK